MSLNDLVNVQITKETAGVSRTGFGVPMVLTYHTRDASRVLEFTSAPDMLTAGFFTYDAAYQLAAAAFAQNPRPPKVLIGRRLTPTTRTLTVTPRSGTILGESFPKASFDYTLTIARDGTEETFTFTSDATPTVAEITAGLTLAINGGTVDVLATDNTTDITIEAAASPGGAATAGTFFEFCYDRSLYSVEDVTPDTGTLATEIANIIGINDDWYALTGDWFGETEGTAVATAIEGLEKAHVMASSDDDIYSSSITDIASVFQDAAYCRSKVFHHTKPHLGISSAMLGVILPTDPGSATWKFKTLSTIPVVTYLPSEITEMNGKNASWYTTCAGRNITFQGKSSSGEFMDITRGVDWLRARLREDVFFQMANLPKIPYTQGGVAIIENAIRGVLQQGITRGFLASDPALIVNTPSVQDVSATDRANRLLPDIDFCAPLAGAIHNVELTGKVSV